ncbi:MAG: tetratricopeptide repeat protein [Chitinophagaceae bacterium]|nr:tetratricopeptide repeat protein [Chitinophagaceae bacterium]
MANEGKHKGSAQPEVVSHTHNSSRLPFWEKNGKKLIYGASAVVLLIAGYFAYQSYVVGPKEEKAAAALWKAEQYFRMDSSSLALNGDGPNQGLLKIISRYGGTKAGNLAKFYAASSYMSLGDFNNALKYLKDFSTDDPLIKVRATGLLADALAETGKKKEAAETYKKAGTSFDKDDFNSPEYLFRAGLLYEDLGSNQDAIAMYTLIKNKYPASERGAEVEKYLARLGQLK